MFRCVSYGNELSWFRVGEDPFMGSPRKRGNGFALDRIPLIPTRRKRKPIPVDITNELSVVLDLVFEESECKLNLRLGQIGKVDLAQVPLRRLQGSEQRLFRAR